MFKFLIPLVPLLSLAVSSTFEPAFEVLERRGAYAGGGWCYISADTGDTSCPVGTTNHPYGSTGCCCPNGYVRSSTDPLACCPQGASCGVALESEPFCADSTWVLWNSTVYDAGSGYFCCLQGQIGTNDQECVNAAVNVAATLSAQSLGQPVPTGSAGVIVSVSVGAAATTTEAVGTTVTGKTTTTTKISGGGVGSKVSSLLGDITGNAAAKSINPARLDLFMPGMIGLGSIFAGFAGMILLGIRI